MSDPFATAEELAQYLALGVPTDLARFQQHLRNASALIRGYCRQELSPVPNDVVTLQANGWNVLFLPEVPVTAVSTVVTGGVTLTAPETRFTENGQLFRLTASGSTAFWTKETVITYTHGFAEFTPEYEEIKRVCIEVAARSITHNKDQTAQAMGGTIMDSAGYSPETFLTTQERWQLADLGLVGVG